MKSYCRAPNPAAGTQPLSLSLKNITSIQQVGEDQSRLRAVVTALVNCFVYNKSKCISISVGQRTVNHRQGKSSFVMAADWIVRNQ